MSEYFFPLFLSTSPKNPIKFCYIISLYFLNLLFSCLCFASSFLLVSFWIVYSDPPTSLQAYLRDIAGLVPDHHTKVSITIR